MHARPTHVHKNKTSESRRRKGRAPRPHPDVVPSPPPVGVRGDVLRLSISKHADPFAGAVMMPPPHCHTDAIISESREADDAAMQHCSGSEGGWGGTNRHKRCHARGMHCKERCGNNVAKRAANQRIYRKRMLACSIRARPQRLQYRWVPEWACQHSAALSDILYLCHLVGKSCRAVLHGHARHRHCQPSDTNIMPDKAAGC
jgi:hypothetical protein